MNADRWREIADLFDRALELAPAERAAFLERASSGRPGLRHEVERLLGADRQPSRALDTPLPSRLAVGLESRRIGAYRLERMVHCGGMGNVYLARRDDTEFERRVAVKVVRRALRDGRAQANFREERQILALLEHPNIARLYDGGTTPDGWPYLVMEYVDGEPITDHCRRRQLDEASRLQLCLEVCDAVDHAHRRGLVHRDLKPANVLVDGSGRPVVVDFGIARRAEGRGSDRPSDGLTPGYASPEQCRGGGCGPAADVFSLGVLVCELVTGSRSAVDRLRGDLAAIVRRARAEAPEDRYPDVGALAADLRRYLARHPVSAVAPAVGYRTRRFVHRNLKPLAGASLALLLLAVAVGVALRGQRLAERQRLGLTGLTRDLVELLSVERWRGAPPDELPAAELMRAAETRIAGEDALPAARTELLATLADTYLESGRRHDALRVASRSLELAASDPAASRGRALHELAVVHAELGDHERGRELLEQALTVRRGELGEVHPAVAATRAALGRLHWRLGDLPRAEAELRAAFDVWRVTCGLASPAAAEGLGDLAALLRERGRVDEAERLLERAEALVAELYGRQAPEAAPALHNRAHQEEASGRLERAEALHRRAVATLRAGLGDAHPTTALGIGQLARVVGTRGRYAESLSLFDEALATLDVWGERGGAEYLTLVNNRAVVLGMAGHHAEAERQLHRVLVERAQLLGDDHPFVGQAHYSLGRLEQARGRLDAAAQRYVEARRIVDAALPDGHPARLYPRVALAHVALERGRSASAARRLEELIPSLEEAHEPGHWRVAEARSLLAAALAASSPDRARVQLAASLPILERQRGAEAPCTRRARALASELFTGSGDSFGALG